MVIYIIEFFVFRGMMVVFKSFDFKRKLEGFF